MSHVPPVPPGGVIEPGALNQAASPERAGGQEGRVPDGQGRLQWRRLLQRKLLIRVTIPTLIGLVQLGIVIVAIFTSDAPARILLWAIPPLLVGYLFGRLTKIAWDDERAQIAIVQAQVVMTAAYVVVRVGSHIAIERLFSGRLWLTDVVLLVSFGLYAGRTVGLAGQIRHVLSGRGENKANSQAPSPR